jgi:hypothetical protein
MFRHFEIRIPVSAPLCGSPLCFRYVFIAD